MYANLLPGRLQFGSGALCEPIHAEVGEQLMGRPQLGASITRPLLAPEPFPVQESRAGKVEAQPGGQKPLDRLLVQSFCFITLREQSLTPCLNAKSPACPARVGALDQLLECRLCLLLCCRYGWPLQPARPSPTRHTRGRWGL